jgi:hypothetical protein
MGLAHSTRELGRLQLFRAAIGTAILVLFSVAPTPVASYHNAQADAFDPQTLNALPRATALRGIRVRGILRLHALSDGPYLYQDMDAYARDADMDRMVTVQRSTSIVWYAERYEAALVVIAGDYRRSACRGREAVCPHLRNELDPRSIDVIGYPDKSIVERSAAWGRRPLRAIGRDDGLWPEISGVAERLVRAILRRDLKTIRALIDPGIAAETDEPADRSRFDDALAPGGRVYWRLFESESAFASERNPRPAFRSYDIDAAPYGNEERSVAICFNKSDRTNIDWPDTEFDLNSANVGDPYTCVEAFKVARGWWFNI